MRIFVSNVDTYLGKHLVSDLIKIHGVRNHIFGTLCDENGKPPAEVKRVVAKAETPRALLKTLLTCRVLVFDLDHADLDELLLLLKVLKITKLEHETVLVLVSSVMVWGRTKKQFVPVDEEAAAAVGEDDEPVEVMPEALGSEHFARRLPHPDYARWKTAETLVLSLNAKEHLKTHVVCPGLLYGCGETTLYDSMQASWLSRRTSSVVKTGDDPRLSVGRNYVPTVHVRDVCRLVRELALGQTEQSYLVCVDKSKALQQDLVQGIVDKVGDPYQPPVCVAEDWQPPLPEGESESKGYLDFMQLDLRFEPCEVMQKPDFAWWCGEGLVQNLERVTDEFCRWRNLRPIRLMLSGPPCSGKTLQAASLAETYGLLHIKAQDFIDEGRERAAAEMAKGEDEEKDEFWLNLHAQFNPEPEEPEEGEDPPPPKPVRLPLESEVELARRMLQKNVCKFRGFVLDGYPRTYAGAQDLFFPKKEEEEDEEAPKAEFDARICPEYFILLDPPLDERRARAMQIAQADADGTHYNAADFERRERSYAQENQNPEGLPSLSDFFADHDIEQLTAPNSGSHNVVEAIRLCIEAQGRAWNYMPAERASAQAALQNLQDNVQWRDEAQRQAKQARQDVEDKVLAQRHEEEKQRAEQLRQAEKEHLDEASRPLKKYLERNVVPILTSGLLETCQVMPEDPVEYLAEYLFTHANDLEVQELHA